jgi:hypothetical protein
LINGVLSGGSSGGAGIGASLSAMSPAQAAFLAAQADLGPLPIVGSGGIGLGLGMTLRCGSDILFSFGGGGGGGFGPGGYVAIVECCVHVTAARCSHCASACRLRRLFVAASRLAAAVVDKLRR